MADESAPYRSRIPQTVILAALLVLVGLFLIVVASDLPEGSVNDPLGPRGFPLLIGVGILGCGVVLFGQALLRRSRSSAADDLSVEDEGSQPGGPLSGMRIILAVLAMLGYVAVLPYAGFLLSTPVVLAMLIGLQGGVPIKPFLFMTIGFPIVLYGLFVLLLSVPLPSGVVFYGMSAFAGLSNV